MLVRSPRPALCAGARSERSGGLPIGDRVREVFMRDRPGCLQGLTKLLMLNWLSDFLQERFGFGRGCSCTGIGCGLILLIALLALSCSVVTGTDWFSLW